MKPNRKDHTTPIRVLVLNEDPVEADRMCARLNETRPELFLVSVSSSLSDAMLRVQSGAIDVVVSDLVVRGSRAVDLVPELAAGAPYVALVLLSDEQDSQQALEAVSLGAQECLDRANTTPLGLARAVQMAVARQSHRARVLDLSLVDELTGLYNRRGFLALGDQQIRAAARLGRSMFLLYVDIDGMKEINDRCGHDQGDLALAHAARILEGAFRQSDVIGRIGGDEFVILGFESTPGSCKAAVSRMSTVLMSWNHESEHPFQLSMSVGLSRFLPNRPRSLEELMEAADGRMYEQKRRKRAARSGGRRLRSGDREPGLARTKIGLPPPPPNADLPSVSGRESGAWLAD